MAGITPPASEVGSDEVLARNLEHTYDENKRKSRDSPKSPQMNKRPRRSLIDSYLVKEDSSVKKGKEEEEDDDDEEEFEVQSIIDLKKTQVGPHASFRPLVLLCFFLFCFEH